ncbi:ribonuclease HI [Trypanosoma cruzi]|nr:ribonuclease HI [Trypanosoma cruzi]
MSCAAKQVVVGVLMHGTTPLVGELGVNACQQVRVPYGCYSMLRVLPGCRGLRRMLICRLVSMYSAMFVAKLQVHGPASTRQRQETLPDPPSIRYDCAGPW